MLKIKIPTTDAIKHVGAKWNHLKFQANKTFHNELHIERLGLLYAMLQDHSEILVELDEELYDFITKA